MNVIANHSLFAKAFNLPQPVTARVAISGCGFLTRHNRRFRSRGKKKGRLLLRVHTPPPRAMHVQANGVAQV